MALKNWLIVAKKEWWGGVDVDIFCTFVPGIQPNTTYHNEREG
jgi:hypothetical protein